MAAFGTSSCAAQREAPLIEQDSAKTRQRTKNRSLEAIPIMQASSASDRRRGREAQVLGSAMERCSLAPEVPRHHPASVRRAFGLLSPRHKTGASA